jgi:hypothetical protein
MNQSSFSPTIDEYLRKRPRPVTGAIPHLAGIDIYGNFIPAGTVGGDLFEYINFQQRYNIDGRIARAFDLAKLYLDPLPAGQPARNTVDDHLGELITNYRRVRADTKSWQYEIGS